VNNEAFGSPGETPVQVPLQITFRHMDPSPAVEARVRELAAELEHFHDQIISCRVVVEKPPKHRHKGGPYAVRIEVGLPGPDLYVDSQRDLHAEHADVFVAVRDAFRALRRRLEDRARTGRGDVKHHESPVHAGTIAEIDPGEGFGRIETADGRLVYFHRNSVKHADFEALAVGTQVRFEEETGDEGPQAVAVRPAGRT
jgi:cold shock CspA family protein/ribosome-associated translation inhibitor RaiA